MILNLLCRQKSCKRFKIDSFIVCPQSIHYIKTMQPSTFSQHKAHLPFFSLVGHNIFMLAWTKKSLKLFRLNNFNTFCISTFATMKYFIATWGSSVSLYSKWKSDGDPNSQTTKTLEGSSGKLAGSYFQVQLLGCSLNLYYGYTTLVWPLHHLQQFSRVKLTHPLPGGKPDAFFPPRKKTLRLNAIGRMQLLFFQNVQVIVYISPEVCHPVHGFHSQCCQPDGKNQLESDLRTSEAYAQFSIC